MVDSNYDQLDFGPKSRPVEKLTLIPKIDPNKCPNYEVSRDLKINYYRVKGQLIGSKVNL